MELFKRANNLVFSAVIETPGEDLEDKICRIVGTANISITPADLNDAFPVGKPKDTRLLAAYDDHPT